MTINREFEKRLREAWLRIDRIVKERKISLRSLAIIAKVNPANCYQCIRMAKGLEDGPMRDSEIAILRALAVALEIPLGYILDGEPSDEVKPSEGVDFVKLLSDSVSDPMTAVSAVMPYLTPEQRMMIHREIQFRIRYGMEAENIRYEGKEASDEMDVLKGDIRKKDYSRLYVRPDIVRRKRKSLPKESA